MDNLPDQVFDFLSTNMRRILILLFTIMVGMVVGTRFVDALSSPAAASQSATKAAKNYTVTMGTVTNSSATTLSLSNDANQQVSFTVSATTRIEAPGITTIKTKPTIKDVTTGSKIAVVSPDQSSATVIVLLPKTQPQKDTTFIGIVSSREATSSGTVLSLKSPKNDEFAKATLSSSTKVLGRGLDKPTIDDVKAGDKIVVIGPTATAGTITVKALYIIPGKARSFLDAKSASPSASAKASPSAKASATPKAATTSAKP